MAQSANSISPAAEQKPIKCVVWDLDNTIWSGILLEDKAVTLRKDIVEALEELDQRGILLSIASRNDHNLAMAKLTEMGIHAYFLHPQINWNAKSASIKRIAQSLNLGLDTFAFVDDDQFERDEVQFELSSVFCFDARNVKDILNAPMMKPRFITPESRLRRQMYASEVQRQCAQEDFTGPGEEFLAHLRMVMTIKLAAEEDLQRAEELTVRTNQLNTTGYVYSYEELDKFRQSPDHLLLVASLKDRYGPYGAIGLSLIEKRTDVWNIKLLLMSCRVMSRGVGTLMMHYIMRAAKGAGVRLQAEFVATDRNRLMLITYRFAGFRRLEQRENVTVFENELSQTIPEVPPYLELDVVE
jgi:FkbH-like protein